MSISAPKQDVILEERTRDAWRRYAVDLRDLSGRGYEEAEHAAWERLQDDLADIAAEHAELAGHLAGGDIA